MPNNDPTAFRREAYKTDRLSRLNTDSVFVTETAVNQQGTAEGSLLPPRQHGQFRVPFITGLKVAKRRSYLAGTEFTLTWQEPEGLTNISHYNIYVTGLLDNNKTPQGPSTVQRSPAVLRLVSGAVSRISFIVQTQLKNGMVSDLRESPTVSSETLVQGFSASDLNGIGTTGQILTWTGSTATLIGPGAANEILTGDGVAIPVFRSRSTLDLVEGRSNLTTADRIVLVSASGVVKQLGSLGTTTTVLHGNAAGAPTFGQVSLTADVTGTLPVANGGTNKASWTAGSVVFVGAGGTALTEDNANLFFDDGNNRLGIGTATPAAVLDVLQATVGNEVQRLASVATNSDPTESVYQNRVATTNATVTTLHTIPIPATTTVAVEAIVYARRTGGAAGTAEDGARYTLSAVYKNVAGTATLIGAVTKVADEDQAGWDANLTPTGSDVLVEVTGAVDNNVTWHTTLRTYAVSN